VDNNIYPDLAYSRFYAALIFKLFKISFMIRIQTMKNLVAFAVVLSVASCEKKLDLTPVNDLTPIRPMLLLRVTECTCEDLWRPGLGG
jgi:hypothetical protein